MSGSATRELVEKYAHLPAADLFRCTDEEQRAIAEGLDRLDAEREARSPSRHVDALPDAQLALDLSR